MNAVMVVGPSRDTNRPPATGQGTLLTVAGLLLVPAVATTMMRLIPPTDDAAALVASFIAYGVIPYGVALLCLLIPAVIWDADQRGLHDRYAGTLVARTGGTPPASPRA